MSVDVGSVIVIDDLREVFGDKIVLFVIGSSIFYIKFKFGKDFRNFILDVEVSFYVLNYGYLFLIFLMRFMGCVFYLKISGCVVFNFFGSILFGCV